MCVTMAVHMRRRDAPVQMVSARAALHGTTGVGGACVRWAHRQPMMPAAGPQQQRGRDSRPVAQHAQQASHARGDLA